MEQGCSGLRRWGTKKSSEPFRLLAECILERYPQVLRPLGPHDFAEITESIGGQPSFASQKIQGQQCGWDNRNTEDLCPLPGSSLFIFQDALPSPRPFPSVGGLCLPGQLIVKS